MTKPLTRPHKPDGRPTLYRTTHARQAYKLALLGATEVEMAEIWGVSPQTVDTWKKTHPKFLESLARGKDAADANVAVSLYKRACGYSHKAVKIFYPAGATEPVYAPYIEYYPPDTQAAATWLRNRQGAKWQREKQTHEVQVHTDARELSRDELVAIAGAAIPQTQTPEAEETVH